MKHDSEKDKINHNKKNDIISFLQIFEKIINNYIFNYKYTFFDTLLNEWYNINKELITDKISELENINSIYFYNCHKYLIYTIINIAKKYKTKIVYNFLYFYHSKLIKEKLIIIRKKIFSELKTKIIEHHFIKDLFLYNLTNNNISVLQKENYIKIICTNLNGNKDDKIANKMNLIKSVHKWKLYSNKLINNENVINFYLDKLKLFRCNAFMHIYKRKLKNLYNIIINKIINGKDIYFIKMKRIKNNNVYILLNIKFNRFLLNSKSFFFNKITSFCFINIKMIFFFKIISHFINSLIKRYKIIFMNNLKIIANKNNNNHILFLQIISYIIFIKNYKLKYFSFYTIKNKHNNKFINKLKTNEKSKEKSKKSYNHAEQSKNNYTLLIKIFNIYYKYKNFKNWKIKQSLKIYFNKWKFNIKFYQYKKYFHYNNILKKKYINNNNSNIIMKNKLKTICEKNKKKKINNNIKEKINNNQNNKNKKLKLSEDIIKIIKNNKINNKYDSLKLTYLKNLENLKYKNESIIANIQAQINKLINEIEEL